MTKNRPQAPETRESNILAVSVTDRHTPTPDLSDYHDPTALRSSDDTTGQRPPAIAANLKDGEPLSPNSITLGMIRKATGRQ